MEREQSDLVELIKKVSPKAWRHVNLGGRFKFNTQRIPPNIDDIIVALENVVTNFLN